MAQGAEAAPKLFLQTHPFYESPNSEVFLTSPSVVKPCPLVAIVDDRPFRRLISCRTFVSTVLSGASSAGGGGTGGIGGGAGILIFGIKKLMLLHFRMGCNCCLQTLAEELRLHYVFQDRSPYI